MANEHRVLYLSRRDVEGLAIPMSEVIKRTEFALSEKGKGNSIMPAKHWIAPDDRRFFSAMSGALPGVGEVSCKWQSGSPDNANYGLPYITGLLILNELKTGLTVAVMDSTWITAQRTAAATAVTASYLAGQGPKVVGIIGCGVQGRSNVDALRVLFPDLNTVRAFDVDSVKLEVYAEDISAKHGLDVHKCFTAHDAVDQADIVVTCGPIVADGDHIIECSWLRRGSLLVTLDYDCYLNPFTLSKFDRVFTDDLEQMQHLKTFGFFTAAPDDVAEVGEVVCGKVRGRSTPEEIILSINMGIAVEDTSLAALVYDRARKQGVGISLPL